MKMMEERLHFMYAERDHVAAKLTAELAEMHKMSKSLRKDEKG